MFIFSFKFRYQKRETESLETVEKFLAEQTEVGNGESARQEATTCPELLNRVCEVEGSFRSLLVTLRIINSILFWVFRVQRRGGGG